ncbi:MAG: hypothetical protein I4O49_06875, partial [Janthinobacterium lividum]|nr:hypothetical protein [Janthinobacterium lividum]
MENSIGVAIDISNYLDYDGIVVIDQDISQEAHQPEKNMKNEGVFTKSAKLIAVASVALFLAACGGGGDGGSTASNGGSTGSTGSTGGTGGTTTPAGTPIDPYTGQAATGTPTASVSGSVVNGPTAGATVTAYVVNSDGTNGTQL